MLRHIIVQKYLNCFETLRKSQLLTDEEYSIVKSSSLKKVLDVDANPVVLERICEGEKIQILEYYTQHANKYNRNVGKIYRKERTDPPGPRIVAVDVPQAAPIDSIATESSGAIAIPIFAPEEIQEPQRTNGEAPAQADPYQMHEEMPAVTVAAEPMLIDENFGSNEVDGARSFLEMCTGAQLPTMSMRQSITRDMVISQFSTIPPVLPVPDFFQEINLPEIELPLFRSPLWASTPNVEPIRATEEPAPQLMDSGPQEPIVVDATNATVPTVPIGEGSQQQSSSTSNIPHVQSSTVQVAGPLIESSSSSEVLAEPPPRVRRTRREVAFTGRLEPYDGTNRSLRPRRQFDIFSFPYHATWNQMIKDVQQLLLEQRMMSLQEVPIMRDAAPHAREAPAVLQQTLNDIMMSQPLDMMTPDISNIAGNSRSHVATATIPNISIPHDEIIPTTSILPLESLNSLKANLVELSDRFRLPSSSRDKGTNGEQPTVSNEIVPDIPPASQQQTQAIENQTANPDQREKRARHNPEVESVPRTNESDPTTNIGGIMNSLITAPESVPDAEPANKKMDMDTMLIDILIAVQGEMCLQERRDQHVPVQRLRQLLGIDSAIGYSKMIKNMLLLKQAGLLDIKDNEERHVEGVILLLPWSSQRSSTCDVNR